MRTKKSVIPLTRNQMIELSDYIILEEVTIDGVKIEGGDNTLRHTENWLDQHKEIDRAAALKWIQSEGGYCDCEVLMNIAARIDFLFGGTITPSA